MLDHQIKQEIYELPQRRNFGILWGGGTKPLHGLTLQVPTSSSGCFHVCADFQDLISEQWAQIEIKWVSQEMKNSVNSVIFKYEGSRSTQKIALRKALHLDKHWASFKKSESVEVDSGIRQWTCRRIESEENSWREGEN